MKTPESRERVRRATAWVATCFVLAGGAMLCLVMSVTLWDDPKWPLVGLTGGAALIGLLLRSLRERSARPAGQLWLWLVARGGERAGRVAYRPGRRGTVPVEAGPNGPPSVEKVRELSDGLHNWRPSGKPVQLDRPVR